VSEITVTTPRPQLQLPDATRLTGVGEMTVISTKEIAAKPAAKIEDLLQDAGLAVGDAGSNFGLTPSVNMRGFGLNSQSGAPSLMPSNVLLNDHADIANGFTRDLSAVERIEVLNGFDSTILGAGSPGGAVNYQIKRPQGKEGTRADASFASDGIKRLMLDTEKNLKALQVRLVLSTQSGQKTVEGLGTDRDNVLLSSSLATPAGAFRLELEYQHNRAPYVFGTFYAAGKFWYDQPYASPQSQASRQSSRAALYYEQRFSAITLAKAWLQQSQVKRDETIIGFWGVNDENTLDGYYRIRNSNYQQQDIGVSIEHQGQIFGFKNTLKLIAQSQKQQLDFNGPQSIAQYTINIQNPVWPIDLSTLTLKPRSFNEIYSETGLALANDLQISESTEFQAGVRASEIHIDTANNSPAFKPTADMRPITYSLGLSHQVSEAHKLWISRAESFMPARGQMRDGAYLPPITATQWELGFKRQTPKHRFIASLFNIQQNNIPATDALDKNYFVPLGGINSLGVTLSNKFSSQTFTLQTNLTFQNAMVTTPTSSGQGTLIAGVPRELGAVKLSTPDAQQGYEAWVSAAGQGKRPADDLGTVYAPGYLRFDAGVTYKVDKWQLAGWVQNLADLRYVQALNAVDNVWQGARRSLWVNASYQY
jgi:outer membrane receptor protein involved in Fe transport